jgi:antirestriction protein ArdC
MIHRTYAVFNAEQIDGIPKLELPARRPFEVIEPVKRC